MENFVKGRDMRYGNRQTGFLQEFSALGPFQSEGRLWYELSGVLGAEQEFCVRLRREVACGHCGMQAHICTGGQLARQFLRFLYENAIQGMTI